MDTFHFLTFSLAVWRLSSLLVNEEGPFNLFVGIRKLAKIEHDADNIPILYPSNELAQMLSCLWCTSIWVALAYLLFWLAFPVPAVYLSYILGMSAIAVLIDKMV